ncbi:MAG TPA: NAD(P)/FAD-dependent oxidoreductase, partial [Acidobacteriota bacterium]|nr:NAD(P)/FAD-dependent oxidoreductase [Acidobacteriota bacterium]
APGLKTVEDALEIRRRIFLAFETAEREADPVARNCWMTFIIVGGGPTGVELSGALAELAHHTLRNDFRRINPAEVKILLLEAGDRILPSYQTSISAKAENALARLGVSVQTRCMVKGITPESVSVQRGEDAEEIGARTVLWAAGVKASALAKVLAERTGVSLDRMGRVMVNPDLTVPNHSNIFVIGDLAHFAHQTSQPLPGVAPVAMQQGRYVGRLISERLRGKELPAFHYVDKGSLAVIGRNAAVAQRGSLGFNGFFAWLAWVFVHIYYLIEFDNKLRVMIQWAWHYFTRKRGARLITGEPTLPDIRKIKI